MTAKLSITRIDHEAPGSKAAVDAERALFATYGLEYKAHLIEMKEPDLRLRVLEVGSGRPLLMMPGGAGDAWPLAALIAELREWRVIAINRVGGGLSDGIDHRQVDLRRLAVNTFLTVADAFGLERTPVVANSMGGLWSFYYALEHPERVSRMVQMGCPALLLDTSAPAFMRLLSVPGVNRLIAPMMQPKSNDSFNDLLRTQGSSQEAIEKMPATLSEAAFHFWNLPTYLDSWKTLISSVVTLKGARSRYSLKADHLEQVRPPIQFIWGDNDPFGGLDIARQATRLIPQANLYEMEAGHLPFMDKPGETGRVIREFLAGEPPESPTRSTFVDGSTREVVPAVS